LPPVRFDDIFVPVLPQIFLPFKQELTNQEFGLLLLAFLGQK
jgi:hypothetical protein